MAQIYPRLSDAELNSLPSKAEAVIYRQLRDLDYPGLEVYHSLATQNRDERGTWIGEIDFLLFHPQEGIQLWEVKGGGIRIDGQGRWFSQGNQGEFGLTTTPLAQLQKTTGSLLKALEKALGQSIRLPIAPVLVFPDTTRWQGNSPDLALNEDHLLLRNECVPLTEKSIKRRFKNAPFSGPRATNDLPLSSVNANLIRTRLLRPLCALISTATDQADAVEAELFRLSNEQQWVMRLLENIPRMGIFGGAGTGKSILARLRVQQLAEEGKKVLLLCFNNALADEHRKQLEGSSNLENIEIATFHQLCASRAEAAGLAWQPEKAKKLATFYNETAPNLLLEALEKNPEVWDGLVVDEAQDYLSDWWLILNEMLAEKANVTLVADPQQDLYMRGFTLPTDVFSDMVPYPFTLHKNHRNAYEIATWLKESHSYAAEPSEQLPSSNRPVETFTWKDEKQQLEKLKEQLTKLEDEGFTPKDLLLLTPHSLANSAAIQGLLAERPQYKPSCFNVAAAKGLEARGVLLLDLGTNEWTSKPAMEYVGASRAKVFLKLFKKI